MEAHLPLIGLIAWAIVCIGVGFVLDRAQNVSRPVPVIRPWYQPRDSRHR
jgi:hypothetical protein